MSTILRRYAGFRRFAQISFVLGGALISSVAGTVAKLVGPPTDAWLYWAAIGGSILAFLVTVLFQFVDEGAAEVTARALDVIDELKTKDGVTP